MTAKEAKFKALEKAAEKVDEETNNFSYLNILMCAYQNAQDTESEGGFDWCEGEEEKREAFWDVAYGSIVDSVQSYCVDMKWFTDNGYCEF